jgi:hypothetical protein
VSLLDSETSGISPDTTSTNGDDMAPRGYLAMKALAKRQGCSLETLLALAKKNDPFYCGAPAHVDKAQWFSAVWRTFAYSTAVHLRRIHYQLVSQHDPRMHDGTPYQNTERCWDYLSDASKAARILGLVLPTAFEDRRNPPAHVPWSLTPEATHPFMTWDTDMIFWALPKIQTALSDWLDMRLPQPQIEGYDYSQRHQPYHLEIWIEKSTMDDVLIPFARTYGAVLVTSIGFQSMTRVIELLHRVAQAEKPARIFYLSDFDPAGDGMPVAVARQIEYWALQYAPSAEIKLTPLGLTRAQVQQYRLPRIPIKDTDARKAGFEERYGEGAVELDALEALYPGELAVILQDALDPYYDHALADRMADAEREVQADAEARWQDETEAFQAEIEAIEAETAPIYARYQDILEDLNTQLSAELEPFAARLAAVRHAVLEAQAGFVFDMPDRPQPEVAPADESAWLFDSARAYLAQLAVYKVRRNGARGEESEVSHE